MNSRYTREIHTPAAAAKAVDTRWALTRPELLGAIARGWCHPVNARKRMDPDLAEAIYAELWALLKGIKP